MNRPTEIIQNYNIDFYRDQPEHKDITEIRELLKWIEQLETTSADMISILRFIANNPMIPEPKGPRDDYIGLFTNEDSSNANKALALIEKLGPNIAFVQKLHDKHFI